MTTLMLMGLGLLVGGITGITGASGVLILVPFLTTFSDLPLKLILGTSLLVDVITSVAVSFAYYKNKHIDIKGSLWLLIGSLLGAQAGAFFVIIVSRIFIVVAIALAMIVFGFKMWKSGLSNRPNKKMVVPEYISLYLQNSIGMVLSGFVIGLLTGIFGAGGGLAIFIVLYSLLRFSLKNAVGTSSFIMLLTALSGVSGYAQNGNLDMNLGLIIGISAGVGGVLSSLFANRINDEFLTKLIGGIFILMALVMVVLKIIAPMF